MLTATCTWYTTKRFVGRSFHFRVVLSVARFFLALTTCEIGLLRYYFFPHALPLFPPTFTDAPSLFLPSRISNETIPCVFRTYRRSFRYSLPPILLFLPSCCRLFAFPWPLLIFLSHFVLRANLAPSVHRYIKLSYC